jgi:hypothetical protein
MKNIIDQLILQKLRHILHIKDKKVQLHKQKDKSIEI